MALLSFSSLTLPISLSLIVFALLWVAFKVVIRPLYRMSFYKKQGLETYYTPLIGRYRDFAKAGKEHGDDQYITKRAARVKPTRALCSNLGSSATVVLHDPALVKEFYLNNDNYIKDPMYLELLTIILGRGVLTSEGSQWKSQRKMLSNVFHFEFLKTSLPAIQATIHQMLYDLRKGNMEQVNVMDEFQRITGEIIGRIFFGEQLVQYSFEGKPLTKALEDIFLQMSELSLSLERFVLGVNFIKLGIFPKHRELINRVKKFRGICRTIIDLRKKQYDTEVKPKENKDMLDLLLAYTVDGVKVSDEEIIDQFITFFLAGMDTTGHLLTVTIYYLYSRPEYRAKVMTEIKENYPVGKPVTIDNLNNFDFTMAILKETLRAATPVVGIFSRLAIRDHKIGDLKIRKGDVIDLEYFYNSYNPVYFENPDDFSPERWLDKQKAVDSFAFTPFSAGPRNCIGQHLAMIESRIILSEFLTMYDFQFKEGYKFQMKHRFLYEPVDPIVVKITPKETN